MRAFFKWLTRQNALLSNPASELELPRLARGCRGDVLTASEAERCSPQPNVADAGGHPRPRDPRDAVLDGDPADGGRRTAGLRRGRRAGHADGAAGQGQEGPDDARSASGRSAGSSATSTEVRPELVVPPDEGVLFLTTLGEPLTPDWLTQMVREYVSAAELGKSGACHLFRHTMATLMLEGGADIRYIQEMLGHASLDSTEIYTQVSIRKLKAIHAATHPSAKLRRCEADPEREAELDAGAAPPNGASEASEGGDAKQVKR